MDAAAVARVMLVEAQTAALVRAFRAVSIEPIVLKGPSFAKWLYADGEHRPYWDTDLLVDPDRAGDAEAALSGLGYVPEELMPGATEPAVEWFRLGSSDVVDLHTSIRFFDPAVNAWKRLLPHTHTIQVGGENVTVLDDAGNALHVVTHAVQNSLADTKANLDFRRALAQAPDETWARAASIAESVGASEAFATGLWSLPDGRELAHRIGVAQPASNSFTIRLRMHGDEGSGAASLHHLAELAGVRARVMFVCRKTFPTRRYVLQRAERAGIGKRTTTRAYLDYWWKSLLRLPRAFRIAAAGLRRGDQRPL